MKTFPRLNPVTQEAAINQEAKAELVQQTFRRLVSHQEVTESDLLQASHAFHSMADEEDMLKVIETTAEKVFNERLSWSDLRLSWSNLDPGSRCFYTAFVSAEVQPVLAHKSYTRRPANDFIRFWKNIEVEGSAGSDCWLWTGRLNVSGIGQLLVDHAGYGPTNRTARWTSWTFYKGHLDLHSRVHLACGNKLCVKPSHIELGSK